MHTALERTIATAMRTFQGIEGVLRDHQISIDPGESQGPTNPVDPNADRVIRVGVIRVGSLLLRVGLHCRVDEQWASASLGLKAALGDDDYAIDLTHYVEAVRDPRWNLYFGERAIDGLSTELEREYGSNDVTDAQALTIAHRIATFCTEQLRAS